jgi:CI-like repressor metal proteinase motif protein|nr:MAG TPA: IrrE protein [Caudoviricetes sp.]
MTESELLEQFAVSLCEFSSNEWSRNGFIDPINRVVYINGDLPPETRLKVILHELGHLEHNSKDYERLREKYEAQANRDMIRGLLENESLDDFNMVYLNNYCFILPWLNVCATVWEGIKGNKTA